MSIGRRVETDKAAIPRNKGRKIYDEITDTPLKIEMFRCENGKRYLLDTKNDREVIEAIVKGGD